MKASDSTSSTSEDVVCHLLHEESSGQSLIFFFMVAVFVARWISLAIEVVRCWNVCRSIGHQALPLWTAQEESRVVSGPMAAHTICTIKVSGSNSISHLKHTYIWVIIRCMFWCRTDTKKTCIGNMPFWTTSSKQGNHSNLNSQHNLGDLYDHSMNKRISILMMNNIIIWEWLHAWFEFANPLPPIACFMSYKLVQRKKCSFKTHLP